MARKIKKGAAPQATKRSSDEEFILNFFIGLFLFAVSMFIFARAYHAGYIWDDDQLLTQNPQVHALNGWWTLWLKPITADYFPLTSLTLWAQWQFSHNDNSAAYHVANILFHAITVVLTWQTLKRLKIPGAAVIAAIFAVHPICVESVAWISERKNTVSQIFFLLSIINYVRYQERGPLWRYVAALLCFTLSLLAKTSVVMLPFILLLLTWWRYRDLLAMRDSYDLKDNPRETGILVWSCAAAGEILTWGAIVKLPFLTDFVTKIVNAFGIDRAPDFTTASFALAIVPFFVWVLAGLPLAAAGYCAGLQLKNHKIWNRFASFELIRMIPFFLVALILGAVTVYFQNVRAVGDEVIPIAPHLWQRACSACFAAGFYLYSAIWPFNIIEIYPEWHRHFPTWEKFPAPHFAPPNKEAIPYYIQVIPGLLIAGLLIWCWVRRAKSWARATLTGLGCYFIAMLPALGFTTMSYMRLTLVADHFQYISIVAVIALVVAAGFNRSFNPIYLFGAALILSIITYINWGQTQDNRVEEILWILGLIALALAPRADDSIWKMVFYGYLALLFLCFGIVTFNQAALYQDEGTLWGATLAKNPDSWQAHNHYGAWLYQHGDIPGAAPHFRQATILKPENPESHNNLGLAESYFADKAEQSGDTATAATLNAEALQQFLTATQIKDDPNMDDNLANKYLNLGRFDDAIHEYNHAIDLQPGNPGAWCNRGVALMHEGRVIEAVQSFMNAVQFAPGMPEGSAGLAAALRALGIDPDAPVITGTYPFDVNKAIQLLHMVPMPQQQ
jgi:tetratricopeptide (TPR) repeat protein